MAFRNAFASVVFGYFLACLGAANLHAAEPAALTQAVLAGDAAQVRAALAGGASPGAVDPEVGHSALHLAVAEGGPRDATILDLLLARKPDLDAEDAQSKTTPLTAAMVVAQQGPFASIERSKATVLVERLLKAGASATRATSGGDTPLLVAVGANNLEVVKLLLARGANPALRTGGKASALQLANASGRSKEMLDTLRAAAPPVVAARGAGADASPDEAETAPVPEKSSVSGWFIGGAAIAAAGVIAALVANQKRKNATNQAQQQAQAPAPVAPSPQPPVFVAPQPAPQPAAAPAPQPVPPPAPQPVAPPPQPQPPGAGVAPSFTPSPQPAASQIQIVQAAFFPPVPQFGQNYSVRVTVKNVGGSVLDGSYLTITSDRRRIMSPQINFAIAPQQLVEIESPGYLFDGQDSVLTLAAIGMIAPNRMISGINYQSYNSLGTITLPALAQPVAFVPPTADGTARLQFTNQALMSPAGDAVFATQPINVGKSFAIRVVLQNTSNLPLPAAIWGVLEGDRLLYAERRSFAPNAGGIVLSTPILYDGNPRQFTIFAVGSGISGDVQGASVRTAPGVYMQGVGASASIPAGGPLPPNDRPAFSQAVDGCLQMNMQSSDGCPAPWYFGIQVINKCSDRRLIETCTLRDRWGQCTGSVLLPGGSTAAPSCGQPGANGYRVRSAAPAVQNGVVGYPLPPLLYGPSMESRRGWPGY